LCGSCPPKNCRSASSEKGNVVTPRDTVWVVNTVTTLGATFSTIGAKLVITPGCVGAVSCAAGEEALVEKHRMAPINSPRDQKIPFCINVSPSGNRTLDRSRPFANSIGNEDGTVAAATPQLVGKIAAFAA